MMSKIRLSIITINLNNKAGLERTIESVTGQTYSDFEFIVIDGGSLDGSVEIIKKHEEKITLWMSENDKGIYNAMNKGILKANGEYCLFINSGDFFIKSSILAEMISYINDEDILYGNGYFQAKDNKLDKLECPEKLTLGFFTTYSLFHPATLIKKNLFYKYGFFNEANKIVSDGEFFIKTTILNNVKCKLIPLEIAIAEDNGVSRNDNFKTILDFERAKLFRDYFPDYVLDFMNDYRDLKFENMQIKYDNNKLSTELNSYKKNLLFRAILRWMRLLNRAFQASLYSH
jgi:glycosyltransferase involved in cell wall biosynthesis